MVFSLTAGGMMAEGMSQEERDLNFEGRIYKAFLPMQRNTLYSKV